MHIEDVVAVVSHKATAPYRLATPRFDVTRHQVARHRDDLNREREAAEDIDQLGVIHDTYELPRRLSHDLLAGECTATTFDQVMLLRGLVSAIDIQFQGTDIVQVFDRDARCLQTRSRGLRAGDGAHDPFTHTC